MIYLIFDEKKKDGENTVVERSLVQGRRVYHKPKVDIRRQWLPPDKNDFVFLKRGITIPVDDATIVAAAMLRIAAKELECNPGDLLAEVGVKLDEQTAEEKKPAEEKKSAKRK